MRFSMLSLEHCVCSGAAGCSPIGVEFCPSSLLPITVYENQEWKLIVPAGIIKIISAYPLLGQEDLKKALQSDQRISDTWDGLLLQVRCEDVICAYCLWSGIT